MLSLIFPVCFRFLYLLVKKAQQKILKTGQHTTMVKARARAIKNKIKIQYAFPMKGA